MGKSIDKIFAENDGRFKILTDGGFSDFIGVTKTPSLHDGLLIKTSDGGCIKITRDHKVYLHDMSHKMAFELQVGDNLKSDDGFVVTVDYIEECDIFDVYDVLHVFNGNRFFISNGKRKLLIFNCLYLDELAFINNVEEFYESVFPTISSSNKTKVIITSTPLGLNFFYKMWVEAEEGRSPYVPYDVKWYEHPERDQKWYDTMCGSMSATAIEQEMNCVSGDTMITVDGMKYTMESLYNKLNHNDSVVAYVNDINIDIAR